jgi:DNA mismatch repair protein MutS
MQQYNAVKTRYPHALLLFRLGDFYELFYEDAIIAARELQITLTSRNREKGQPIPMCGVPYHAADGYIARLIRAGFKVAICEQMEQPGRAKNSSAAKSPASSLPAPPPTSPSSTPAKTIFSPP